MEMCQFNTDLENVAMSIVGKYVEKHLDKTTDVPDWRIFVVWKSKVLQNWKFLISTTLADGMYYELTYNGDRQEYYLDAYKKFDNRCIPVGSLDV